ncbi:MAG TPA: hypothetical protein VMR16_03300, partial [Candidatus Saccharimonadales bacterium]|nr:hypothetical protein [Candidatus Saccharimonadales bacterium]
EETYKLAETLQKRTDADVDELSKTKPTTPDDVRDLRGQLNKADALLNASDEYRAKLSPSANKEYVQSPIEKRGFHLGVRAVMNSINSTIKSALNRHN